MTSFRFSLQAQLALFIAAFLAIVLGLAVLSAQSLRAVDAKTDALAAKWIEGTRILGELSDRISEFRIAETYRALAKSEEERIAAEQRAADDRLIIGELQRDYFALFQAEHRPDLARFRAALAAYLAAHDLWMTQEPDLAAIREAQGVSALHDLYRATDEAADAAIDELKWSAHAEADTAARVTEGALKTNLLASALAIALAIWLLFRVKQQITRPLAAITASLADLAAGNRFVEVPGIGRNDEIGAMAKSFDVFRANAQALERAHEATRAAQERAQILARQDSLTGLPNRRMLVADLHAAIERVEDGATACALLFVDLDRFKPINDLEGHRVGDAVLCEVARRLRQASRKSDVVARLGGDEFAILIEMAPATHVDQATRVAGRALAAIAEPIEIGDRRVELSASVGVSLCPEDGLDVSTLLRAADIAMYHAKRDGRGLFRFFEQSMDEELRRRAELESALKKAVAAGDIRPFYQPLVDLRDNRVYGFEVLSRWTHEKLGAIPPDVFIPLAEQIGVIADLTWSVVRRACREALQWGDQVRLSVNVSPVQLKDPLLASRLLATLEEEKFPPSRLDVEITESALVDDVDTARATLAALQAEGIRISLDDFGTGYSSLYHLRAFHFDKVKIDRSFVLAMQHDEESGRIVDAILSLLKHLGVTTVAEGVETVEVLRRLAENGCEIGQGFYFGKAMTIGEASKLLRRRRADRRVA
ncbi:EAL domain-containing protein [Methylosinus sp. H3A]|uniref:putative bifunctional diguanylate cyclase/phosphodiesterase n=1 Tax=Methylosinus sp. H3A TaxID=2785786 RepID=UPI0018C30D30|nr:EAL domain-containing protein [Methylosinus sp. H3A]MBG0810751.1 EAL domain-containing protein [Methylosinus sp. H3A]